MLATRACNNCGEVIRGERFIEEGLCRYCGDFYPEESHVSNLDMKGLVGLIKVFTNERYSFFETGVFPACFGKYDRVCGKDCVYKDYGTVCPDSKEGMLDKDKRLALTKRMMRSVI